MGGVVIQPTDFKRSIGLSIVLHASLLGMLALFWMIVPRPRVAEPLYIELEPTAQEKGKIRNRIVQTERGHETKVPPQRAFLGEHTQTVDRETVGPTHEIRIGQEGKSAKPQDRTQKTRQRSAKSDSRNPLAELGLALLPSPGAVVKAPPQPDWATPGVRPEDDVPGLQTDERTALNTREYVFFGYYQRIRERLDRAWVPILRQKVMAMYRQGRQLASDREHTTRVMVVLNPRGEITRVELRDESGTQELDEAAVKAFNQAGPFPNPPSGMIDRAGEIKIPWDFILRT